MHWVHMMECTPFMTAFKARVLGTLAIDNVLNSLVIVLSLCFSLRGHTYTGRGNLAEGAKSCSLIATIDLAEEEPAKAFHPWERSAEESTTLWPNCWILFRVGRIRGRGGNAYSRQRPVMGYCILMDCPAPPVRTIVINELIWHWPICNLPNFPDLGHLFWV